MVVSKELLMHWWHYYGKAVYTLAEFEEFMKIIDERGAEKVLEAAVASYIVDDGSPTTILLSIRNGLVNEMFEALPDISKFNNKEAHAYKKVSEEFVRKISQTFH